MRLRVIVPNDVTNGEHARGHLGHRHRLTVRRRTDTRARPRLTRPHHAAITGTRSRRR
jgi:hypothetical protein